MLTAMDSIIQIERHPVIAKLIPLLPEKAIKELVVNETGHILMGVTQSKRKLKEACLLYTVNATQNAYR